MAYTNDDADQPSTDADAFTATDHHIEYVKVGEMRSADDVETCLRPLGLCELGGSCDSCWYRPDHPRFKK